MDGLLSVWMGLRCQGQQDGEYLSVSSWSAILIFILRGMNHVKTFKNTRPTAIHRSYG